MDEQVTKKKYRSGGDGDRDGDGDDERVREWEAGLPNTIDLTPLSHLLISPELASAFSISAEPHRSVGDVNRASQNTLSNIRRQNSGFSSNNLKSFMEDRSCEDPVVVEGGENDCEGKHGYEHDLVPEGSSDKRQKIDDDDCVEEADLGMVMENCATNDDASARTLKRPRLVWTPQLHKRFVDVVAHLGIKNAVPKTIMQLMNVEGLTRENVASHLQKYRLYLKRMQGLTNEGPSSSDKLFASTPVPQSLCEASGSGYMAPQMMPPYGGYGAMGHGHMGMSVGNAPNASYGGFQSHPYNNMYREHQGDWSGNKFGSAVQYSHATHINK